MLTGTAAMALALPDLADELSLEALFQTDINTGLDTCSVVGESYNTFSEQLVQGVTAGSALDVSFGLESIVEIQVRTPLFVGALLCWCPTSHANSLCITEQKHTRSLICPGDCSALFLVHTCCFSTLFVLQPEQ